MRVGNCGLGVTDLRATARRLDWRTVRGSREVDLGITCRRDADAVKIPAIVGPSTAEIGPYFGFGDTGGLDPTTGQSESSNYGSECVK